MLVQIKKISPDFQNNGISGLVVNRDLPALPSLLITNFGINKFYKQYMLDMIIIVQPFDISAQNLIPV